MHLGFLVLMNTTVKMATYLRSDVNKQLVDISRRTLVPKASLIRAFVSAGMKQYVETGVLPMDGALDDGEDI